MWMLLVASIVVASVVWLVVAIIAAALLVGGWLDRRDGVAVATSRVTSDTRGR